jgi:hypothetical protein
MCMSVYMYKNNWVEKQSTFRFLQAIAAFEKDKVQTKNAVLLWMANIVVVYSKFT